MSEKGRQTGTRSGVGIINAVRVTQELGIEKFMMVGLMKKSI